jgi:hypothetical protein
MKMDGVLIPLCITIFGSTSKLKLAFTCCVGRANSPALGLFFLSGLGWNHKPARSQIILVHVLRNTFLKIKKQAPFIFRSSLLNRVTLCD